MQYTVQKKSVKFTVKRLNFLEFYRKKNMVATIGFTNLTYIYI